MIKLNLGSYDGNVDVLEFQTKNELCDFLEELDRFECIWLNNN